MNFPLPTCGGCRRGSCQGHGGYNHGPSAHCAGHSKNQPPSQLNCQKHNEHNTTGQPKMLPVEMFFPIPNNNPQTQNAEDSFQYFPMDQMFKKRKNSQSQLCHQNHNEHNTIGQQKMLPVKMFFPIPSRNANQQPSQNYDNAPQTSHAVEMIQKSISSIGNSRNQPPTQLSYQEQGEYNTIGQLVQTLPTKMLQSIPENNSAAVQMRNAVSYQQPQQNYNNAPQPTPAGKMIQKPIFPIDNSRNQPPTQLSYQEQGEYNTIGQLVHMLPTKMLQSIPENNSPAVQMRNADTYQQPQSYDNAPQPSPPNQRVKEPIFPVDKSRNQPPAQLHHQKHYEYNTLGQPVQMLPAKMFHAIPENNLQQTLSPQPVTNSRFVVKNTVSKTASMRTKPLDKVPSRGQLQHSQYKGSHSYTEQNIRSPGQGATLSEGKINVSIANPHRHVPVERVGGDTLGNNQMINNPVPVKGQPMGHIGDAPASVNNKPHGDIAPANVPIKKTRNGLQDLVYTSYPTSAAWSFHGNDQRVTSHFPSTRYCRKA